MDDVAQICRLKHQYMRGLDTRDWHAFVSALTADVTADYGQDLTFRGREALVAWIRGRLNSDTLVITDHQLSHPEIDVNGDTATGSWYLNDTVITADQWMRGAAYYTDTYRREADGHWRIASTGYQRLYVAVLPTTSLPGLHVTSPWGDLPTAP